MYNITNSNQLDSMMAVCAFRYCLGRMTYVVKDCVDYLITNWPFLEETDRQLIVKEIREALRSKHAGMQMDEAEWTRLLQAVVGGH